MERKRDTERGWWVRGQVKETDRDREELRGRGKRKRAQEAEQESAREGGSKCDNRRETGEWERRKERA